MANSFHDRNRAIVKLKRVALVFVVLLAAVPVAASLLLLYTQTGARWALEFARDMTDGALDYAALDGSIARGIVVESPSFTQTGLVITASELRFGARLSLLPMRVEIANTTASDLDVDVQRNPEAGQQDKPVEIRSILESLALPVHLVFAGVEVDTLTIRENGRPRFRADRAAVIAEWHDRITIHSFEVQGPDLYSRAGADISLEAPFAVNADIETAMDLHVAWLPQSSDVKLRLDGNLDRLQVDLRERVSGLEATGTLDTLLDDPAWDLVVRLREYAVPPKQDLVARDVVLASSGRPGRFDLEADVALDGAIQGAEIEVKARARGSTDGLDIEKLSIAHPAATLTANGRLDASPAFRGALTIERIALEHWLGVLDKPHTVTGSAQLELSKVALAVKQGRLSIVEGKTKLTVDAALDLQAGSVVSELAWTDLRWPLIAKVPNVESNTGRASLSGTLDDWQVDLTTVVSAPGIAQGRLGLAGEGTRYRAAFDVVEGEVLGGVVDGGLEMDWSRGLNWSSSVEIKGLRTATLAPAYPGILTVRARAENAAPSGVSIDILDLRGTLLDEAIAGSGKLLIAPNALQAGALRVSHGRGEIEADGDLFGSAGLDFSIEIPDIGVYGSGMEGDIAANGTIALGSLFSRTRIDATSAKLALGRVGIKGLGVRSGRSAADGVKLEIELDQLRLGSRTIDTIDLVAEIDPDQQRLVASMRPIGSDVRIGLAGSFADGADVLTFPWTGQLEELSLTTRQGEGGGLDAPVPVSFSPQSVAVTGMCLSGDLRGRICTDVAYDADGGLKLAADATDVPVDVLNAFLQTGFEFEQSVSGQLRWEQDVRGTISGKADIQVSPGQLKSARFPDLDLRTGPGKLGVEIESGELLSGLLELPVGNNGIVDGWFRLEGAATDAASRIAGALRAETSDVDILAVLLPDVDEARGRLTADLELSGTVDAPRLIGSAAIADGALNYFPLGLRLTELNVAGQFDENRHIDVEGTFRAGEGSGAIRTSTVNNKDEGPGVHLGIRGTGLTVIDLPDITAVADADLEIDFQGQRLDIHGSVDIPRARIRPVNLVTTRVDASEDVVIVAGRLAETQEVEQKPGRLAVHGALSLGMGDDVQIRLDVARASISGRADFEWSGDPVPVGHGRYNVNGTVSAFGQVLSISEGSVSFPGVPATNPLLNIRATRDIYGNTQVKRAGILVQGSVNQPTIEAYTYPLTTEERALTLLVTGNDFDYEQGVGAIDFGTYIAPRLFLSYGVGVFDRQNVISARYDLKAGFGIRATSAERESGVDLTYRFEN